MTDANPKAKIIRTASSLLILFFLSLSPVISFAQDVHIEGRVFTQNGPLQGATVQAYKNYRDIGAAAPFLTSGPTDVQGHYALQLAAGEYYFTARGNDQDRSVFAYHGSNPIRVGENNIWIALMATEESQPVYSKGDSSAQGTVTYKGKPVGGAHVSFYTLEGKEFKGLGFLAGKKTVYMTAAAEDGTFSFPLPPESYVIIARKNQKETKIMPLRSGDLFCYAPANPVEIKTDMTVRITLPCYPKSDRLSFVDSPKIKASPFLTVDDLKGRGKSGIKGKVTDEIGKPLPGIYVIAYKVIAAKLNHETENITQTDAEGKYFVQLYSDGSYGLVARETLGVAPDPEELTGLHRENPWSGIAFQTGQVIDHINITLKKGQEVDHEPEQDNTPLETDQE